MAAVMNNLGHSYVFCMVLLMFLTIELSCVDFFLLAFSLGPQRPWLLPQPSHWAFMTLL